MLSSGAVGKKERTTFMYVATFYLPNFVGHRLKSIVDWK